MLASCGENKSVHIGMKINDEGIKKVIILTGQSNATGVSHNECLKEKISDEKYQKYLEGFDNIYIKYQADNNTSNSFVNVKLGQGADDSMYGPELGIAEKLSSEYPNEEFYIIKCTYSGTTLHDQWLKDGERYDLYNGLLDFTKNAMSELGSEYKIIACCFMQGENDACLNLAKHYYENLNKFVSYLRCDLEDYELDTKLFFIDAGIAQNWAHYKKVNEAKITFAKMSLNNAYIDTIYAGLENNKEPSEKVDHAHYDSLSEILLGNLFADEIIRMLKH